MLGVGLVQCGDDLLMQGRVLVAREHVEEHQHGDVFLVRLDGFQQPAVDITVSLVVLGLVAGNDVFHNLLGLGDNLVGQNIILGGLAECFVLLCGLGGFG